MISDYALQMASGQSAASTAGTFVNHVIDWGVTRNVTAGEQLYAVITIRTTFTQAAADNPIIYWIFYASPLSDKSDSTTAIEVGRTPGYSCNVAGLLSGNLRAGQRIVLPLMPLTTTRKDADDLGATPATPLGRRYLYGLFGVDGAQFTAGTFDVDIMTQSQFGGGSDYSDVPTYPTGIVIA